MAEIDALSRHIAMVMTGSGMTLATAESCTGGLLGGVLTAVPGSSAYYLGGVVSYADGAKVKLLGVPAEVLRKNGAVSRETALWMAGGVARSLGATIGLSVTGIAGPTGGSPEKPVGTTFIGIAVPTIEGVEQYAWNGDRASNRWQSVRAALRLLVGYLESQPKRPYPWVGM